jgi:hypothetical protein
MTKYRVPTLCIAVGALLSPAKSAQSHDQRTNYPSAQEIVKVAEMEQTQSIGTATMQQDRTIVLDLIASGPDLLGDARLTYAPSDPNYEAILRHLGGLRPGEMKQVQPFPATWPGTFLRRTPGKL